MKFIKNSYNPLDRVATALENPSNPSKSPRMQLALKKALEKLVDPSKIPRQV